MMEYSALDILRQLKSVYEKHINSFNVSSYMDDMEKIELLFQRLNHKNILDEVDDLDEWKSLCAQVYELNVRLTDIISLKKVAMNRSRNVSYPVRNNYDAFYIDQKG